MENQMSNISFSKSTFRELHKLNFESLLDRHFQEVANPKYQFKIDYHKYKFMDDHNMLKVYKVLNDGGELVGYSIFLITNPLHYVHLTFAYEDVYYLLPEYRIGWNGVKFFKFILNDLRDSKMDRIIVGTKLKKDNSRLFERLGGKEFEKLFEF